MSGNVLEFISTMNNTSFLKGSKEMSGALERIVQRGAALERLQKRVGSFGGNLMKLGGMGLGLGAFVKEGADFERTLDVAASKMKDVGKGSENYKNLKKTIEELGAETELSNNQITGMVDSLAMAGVTIDKMGKKDLSAMVNFSIAGNTDAQQSADIITNVQSALGDKIIETATSSNTSVLQLGDTLKYAGASAKLAGQSRDTVFALAGALGNVGIQGSMAGTAMSRFFTNIAKNQGKFRELGIEVEKNGKMRNAVDVFKDLVAKTKNLDEATHLNVFQKLFGDEGVRVAGASMADFDKLIKGIENSQGKMAKVAAGINDNVVGDFKELSSVFSSLRNSVFNVFHDDLRKLIPDLQGLTGWVKEFVDKHPTLTKGVIGLGFVKTAMSALISPLMLFNNLMLAKNLGVFADTLKLMKFGFLKMVPAIWTTTALLANPIFWGFAAVAGIVTGFIILYKHVEKFRKMLEPIKNLFKGLGLGDNRRNTLDSEVVRKTIATVEAKHQSKVDVNAHVKVEAEKGTRVTEVRQEKRAARPFIDYGGSYVAGGAAH